MTENRRFCVYVPTTGALLTLLSLTPRAGLPHGAAFAQGDYRPLPLSPDYRTLTGAEGPIARRFGKGITPHELRLSGAPDGGRSWEAPIVLAHLLLEKGWTLVTPDQPNDLVIWATGAVDLDLKLIPGDYAPERKVALSRQALQSAPNILAVLPPGAGQDAGAQALADIGIPAQTPITLDHILKNLPEQIKMPKPNTKPGVARNLALISGIFVLSAAGVAGVLEWQKPAHTQPPIVSDTITLLDPVATAPDETDQDPQTDMADQNDLPDTGPDQTTTATAGPVAVQTAPTETVAQPPQPGVALFEIHASAGNTCRAALFDPALRETKAVPWAPEAGFAVTTFEPSLCGVMLSGTADGRFAEIAVQPEDAFVSAEAPANTRLMFLREGVQNAVYSFPDPGADADSAPLSHEIISPN